MKFKFTGIQQTKGIHCSPRYLIVPLLDHSIFNDIFDYNTNEDCSGSVFIMVNICEILTQSKTYKIRLRL